MPNPRKRFDLQTLKARAEEARVGIPANGVLDLFTYLKRHWFVTKAGKITACQCVECLAKGRVF
jgi:hypothetical protein